MKAKFTILLVLLATVAGLVYYRCPSIDTFEHILYNYNLNIGDTMIYKYVIGSYDTDIVVYIDSTIINGKFYKVFQFSDTALHSGWRKYVVIEGIGCLNNPLFPAIHAGSCFEGGEYLICFSQDTILPPFSIPDSVFSSCFGEGFYNRCALNVENVKPTQKIITLAPNPANNQITITGFAKNTDVAIYDFTGRCIYQNIAEEGKKQLEINTSNWRNGLYFVNIQNSSTLNAEYRAAPSWHKVLILHN